MPIGMGNYLTPILKNESPNLLTPTRITGNMLMNSGILRNQGDTCFMFPGYVRYAGGDQVGCRNLLQKTGAESVKQYTMDSEPIKRKNIVWMLLGDMGTFTTEQKMQKPSLIKGLKA